MQSVTMFKVYQLSDEYGCLTIHCSNYTPNGPDLFTLRELLNEFSNSVPILDDHMDLIMLADTPPEYWREAVRLFKPTGSNDIYIISSQTMGREAFYAIITMAIAEIEDMMEARK